MFVGPGQRIRSRRCLVFLFLPGLTVLPLVPTAHVARAASSTSAAPGRAAQQQPDAQAGDAGAVQQSYAKMDLSFEANEGQTDSQVSFLARGAGYTLFLTADEAVFALRDSGCGARDGEASGGLSKGERLLSRLKAQTANCDLRTSVRRMRVEGANRQAEATGVEKLPGIVNYFVGSDPSQWHTGIPTYERVSYGEV